MKDHKIHTLLQEGPVYIFNGHVRDHAFVIEMSDKLKDLLLYQENEKSYLELIYPLDQDHVHTMMNDFIKSNDLILDIKPHRILSKDQNVYWLAAFIKFERNSDNSVSSLTGYFVDVTPYLIHEDRYLESKERYVNLLKATNEGVWDWDLRTDQVYLSDRWKAVLGYEPHEIGTSLKEWETRVHPDDLQKCFADIASHLNNETDHYENIHRVRHKDGHYMWILDRGIKIVDAEGNTYRMVGTHKDISKERYLNEQLIQLTKEDSLTKLFNRRAFFSIMSHEIAEAKRYKKDMCFMMLDIDLFKQVNDTWGHHFGDDILLNVADVIRQVIRESDYAFRLGGEEIAYYCYKLIQRVAKF